MKTLSITITDDLLRQLDGQRKKLGLAGRSEAVREAIRLWIERRSLQKKILRDIEGYRKKPIHEDEFESLIRSQDIPS